MGTGIHRLTAKSVEHQSKPGLYADGGGLYLQITPAGVKSWLFRYMRQGKARGMGLGPLHTISLAKARLRAQACRELLHEGLDPLEEKKRQLQQQRLEDAKNKCFRECAEAYIAAHRAGWKNAKHAGQWQTTLETYAYPLIGELSVAAIDIALVKRVLEPIWTSKTETASRLRGRIESILDWATVQGFRQGDNPAQWRGRLDKLLPKQSRIATVEHHPALPYRDMAEFFLQLQNQEGTAADALQLLILTATRTSEVINATWAEFDLAQGEWLIPASRMKAGREHRVPLSPTCIALLQRRQALSTGPYVFPSPKPNRPLSNMALLQLLKRMGRHDLTAHGFRSTFRDWAAECTHHPREVAEAALAHVLKDKTEAAYQRGDLFEKRARLMEDWAEYCRENLVQVLRPIAQSESGMDAYF